MTATSSRPPAITTMGNPAEHDSPVGGEVVGVPSVGQALGGLAAALGQGLPVVRQAGRLGQELVRVALGRNDLVSALRMLLHAGEVSE